MSKKTTLVDRASDRVTDTWSDTVERVSETWSDTVDHVLPALESAREAVEEFLEGTAKPVVSTAKDSAQTIAREKGAPLVATGAGLAAQRAGALAVRAEDYARPAKDHRVLRMLWLFVGLAVLGGIVVRRINDSKLGGKEDNWSSSLPQREADDQSGATPGEAVADRAETPVMPTTPDDPAEVIDLPADRGSER